MHHNKPMTNRQKKEYFKQLYKTYRDEMYYVAYSYLQNCEIGRASCRERV